MNSYHNYGLAECPQGFNVIAYAEDGEIEAILSPELRWEAWMWHPEREQPFQLEHIERIRKLFA